MPLGRVGLVCFVTPDGVDSNEYDRKEYAEARSEARSLHSVRWIGKSTTGDLFP